MIEVAQAVGSTPSLAEFDPRRIPMQIRVIWDIRHGYDYAQGVHEVLLSGAVGSSKTLLMAHLVVTHCLENEGAHAVICRLSMPDLKSTLLSVILEHLHGSSLEEGVHWSHNQTTNHVHFSNGSKISCKSWRDKKFKKFRSFEYSMAAIEEITESDENYKEFYTELKQRVGRSTKIKEKLIIAACNPDSPGHWVYKYFIDTQIKTRHVYYSITEQNPFLPPSYLEYLKTSLDPKMAQRMLYGKWIEITQDVIYHQYEPIRNFKNTDYEIHPRHPIRVSHDFNIGEGKPISAILFQYINDRFYFFDEVVLDGSRTLDVYDEIAGRGYLELENPIIVHGDASGKNKDTRSIASDYDLIRKFLSNYKRKNQTSITFQVDVPLANPSLRSRHNRTNAYCYNLESQVRLFIYQKCKTGNEGMRLTELKKGGKYIEDDSKRFQHITTAIGYGIMACTKDKPEIKELNRWKLGV